MLQTQPRGGPVTDPSPRSAGAHAVVAMSMRRISNDFDSNGSAPKASEGRNVHCPSPSWPHED